MDPMPEKDNLYRVISLNSDSLHMNDAVQSLASLFILTSVEFLTLGENLWR